jgi:hypothetical protein
MLGKSPKMSARQAMISISGHAPGHGELPRWLNSIALKVGITTRMARSIWNDEIKNPHHWALEKIQREAEINEARKEAATLAQQYKSIAGGLRAQDENFYRAEIDRLERLARIIGGLDRAGA